MKNKNKMLGKVDFARVALGVLCLAALALFVAPALAQDASPDAYTIGWWTIDGGGGSSSNGAYSLSGTIGQPDAGSPMSGGSYGLQGGFWGIKGIGVAQEWELFMPLVVK